VVYSTLRKFIADNTQDFYTVMETGTARGFSAVCMAKALDDAGVKGSITTYDIIPHNQLLYWNCIDDHKKGLQTRQQLLEPWKDLLHYIRFITGDTKTTLKRSEVDFAFLDGGHTYEDVCHEFNRLVNPKVVVFDDYTPHQFPGVCKAIDETPLKKRYLKAARGYAIGVRK
jgi:predicted O-methyltransferase YrrM